MHSHEHHHHHHLAVDALDKQRRFALCAALNLGFVALEAGFGLWTSSLALLADAGHNFSDVLSLLLAWGAVYLTTLRSNPRRTYGWRRATIYASLLSALLMFMALAAIVWEAIERFAAPRELNNLTVLLVAFAGIVVNGFSVRLLASGRHSDLNLRSAYLHMLTDAGISMAVMLAALLMSFGLGAWLDPLLSVLIVLVILPSTWRLFREAVHLAFDGVPPAVDLEAVTTYLCSLPEVHSCHALHVWALSTTETALTAHLKVTPTSLSSADLLQQLDHGLRQQFAITHVTLQMEAADQPFACDTSAHSH